MEGKVRRARGGQQRAYRQWYVWYDDNLLEKERYGDLKRRANNWRRKKTKIKIRKPNV